MSDLLAAPKPLEYPFGALEHGVAHEIEPGILVLPVPVPFPPFAVNCVAIAETDGPFAGGWTIVDTGLQNDETKAIWAEALAGPLAGRAVKRVIGSHHHPDHIGLAGWLQESQGAELWMTRTAWLFARMMQLDGRGGALSAQAERYQVESGLDAEMLARWRERAERHFGVSVAAMPLGVRTISEGERLRIGGRDWRALFSHGHAPDHLVLAREGDGLTIAGDAALPKITPNIGVYATEPDADPLGDWIAACQRLAVLLDDRALVLPGHGEPYRGAERRLLLVAHKHRRALERLEAHLAEPRTVVDCWPALFRREITGPLEGLATNETRAHLNYLWRRGRISRERRGDGVWLWRAAAV